MAAADRQERVTIFLAFAQDRVDPDRYLRNLALEQERIRNALEPAVAAGLCEVIERSGATLDAIFDVFQKKTGNRIAAFHFGGHAGSGELLLETSYGAPARAHAAGLARFLGEQRGLALVFLNGCSSQGHVEGLLQAGVAAVVATSELILDDVATDFATRFYIALANGATLRSAFAQAEASACAALGEHPRATLQIASAIDESRWPWRLYTSRGAGELAERWNLPEAAHAPLYGLPPLPGGDLPAKPFKHLRWFERSDAAVFFGRGHDIRRLYNALTDPVGAPIVLLFGASGVGKSSLLDAGLRPRLEATHEVRYARHRRDTGLAGTLIAALDASDTESVRQAWQRLETSGRPLIVILDQLEEAWTTTSPGDAAVFVAQLRALFQAAIARPQGRLMLSFRKEWLAEVLRLLDTEGLPRALHELGHLDRAGVIEAITGPSVQRRLQKHYGLDVEDGLPGLIADDLLSDRHSAIAPTLQILLAKWWDRAFAANPAAPQFRKDDYQDLQRDGLLLDDFVTEQLEVLRAAHARDVDSGLAIDLLHFHTTGFGSAEARARTDLRARYGERPGMDALISQCTDAHLLVPGTLPVAPDSGAPASGSRANTRLAHDTLAPLIRSRHEQSLRPGQRATRILEQRAREWEGGKTGVPLDDFDLALVEAGADGMRAWTGTEQRLVQSSREARQKRWRTRRILAIAGALAVTFIAITGVLAWRLALDARVSEARARDRATAAVASAMSEPTDRLLTLLEIDDIDATPTAQSQLSGAMAQTVSTLVFDNAEAGRFNLSGDHVLTTNGQIAKLWDINNTQKPLLAFTGHEESLNAAIFNAAGNRVLTASDDGTARLWDVNNGTQSLRTFAAPGAGISSVAFNAAGDRLLTGSTDGSVRLWDVTNGDTPLRNFKGHDAEVNSVEFNSAGDRMLTASDDATARLWDINDGETSLMTFEQDGNSINSAVFSAQGLRVLTASADGKARLWDIADGKTPVQTFSGHGDSVNSAVFNAKGDRVLTASDDRTVRLWDIENGKTPLLTLAHANWVAFAVFNPAGDRVLTSSIFGVRVFDVPTDSGETPLKSFGGRDSKPTTAVFNVTGDRVLTLSHSGALLWNINDDATPLLTFAHESAVNSAVFNVTGDRVLTASKDGTARLWSIDNDEVPLKTYRAGTEVSSAVFNTAGDRLLTVSVRGAQLWDIDDDTRTLTTFDRHANRVNSAAFNASGDQVLTGSNDGVARLWDIADGEKPLRVYPVDAAGVTSVAFNARGDRILTSSRFLAVLWDINNAKSPLRFFDGHRGSINSAVFNSAGDRVLTASHDGTARLWDTNTGHTSLQTFHVRRDFPAIAASFNQAGDHVLVASTDGQVRLWPAGGEPLKAVARSRTRTCLSANLIEYTLGETKHEAEARHRACSTCVPEYFDALGSFPANDIRRYGQAWIRFKQCYGQRQHLFSGSGAASTAADG